MTDEMSRVIDSIALPYGTEFSPIKPKTGWRFIGEDFWIAPGAVPDILGELLMLVQWRGRADGADELGPGRVYGGPEHEGRYAGYTFRIQELFYDGLHGLGPVGEIRRKCG